MGIPLLLIAILGVVLLSKTLVADQNANQILDQNDVVWLQDYDNVILDMFSSHPVTRQQAEAQFYKKYRGNVAALNALVDYALEYLPNRGGIYSTLSTVKRIPVDTVPESVRQKILQLADRVEGYRSFPQLVRDVRIHFAQTVACAPSGDQSTEPNRCARPFPEKRGRAVLGAETKPPAPAVPTYTIRIHEITPFKIVSRDNPLARQSDTDFISLAAQSSAGEYGPVNTPVPITLGHDELGKPAKVDLKIEHMPVPSRPGSTLKVAWTIFNKGHGAVEDDIHFVSDATSKALESLGSANGNPVLFGVGALIGFAGSEWLTDCDWQIARAGIVLTSDNLYKQNFHQVFDYPAATMQDDQHKLPCSGDAHYNMELFIEKDSSN